MTKPVGLRSRHTPSFRKPCSSTIMWPSIIVTYLPGRHPGAKPTISFFKFCCLEQEEAITGEAISKKERETMRVHGARLRLCKPAVPPAVSGT